MKMDGFVNFTWKEVYWPFWIFFSILIGLSFSIFLIVITKLLGYIFYRKDDSEMLTLLWLFYFIDGFTIMVCLFVIYSQSYLSNNDTDGFKYILIIFISYCIVGYLYTMYIKKHLILFVHSISNDNDITHNDLHINIQHINTDANTDDGKKKEKKQIEIPEYLYRYSSTFFKTATKKDVLFKKLFSKKNNSDHDKMNIKDNNDHIDSSSKDSKHIKTKSVISTGKSLKKTDMSMNNYHINIKDNNNELLKHFRSMSYNRFDKHDVDNKVSDDNNRIDEPHLATNNNKDGKMMNDHNESMNNICSVCFANEPDSVFMRCGHGGVCYQCAIDIWKSTGECYLCRDEIEQILQVEAQQNEQGEQYLKVIASTQLVDEDDTDGNNSNVEYIN